MRVGENRMKQMGTRASKDPPHAAQCKMSEHTHTHPHRTISRRVKESSKDLQLRLGGTLFTPLVNEVGICSKTYEFSR